MNKYIVLVSVLALAIIAAACAPAPTSAPTPAPTTAPVTEANKALVRRYVEQVLIQGKLDSIGEFASPDYKRYVSATAAPLNIEGNKQRLAGLGAALPDKQVTIDDIFAEGDRVAWRLTVRGTHQGVLQGIPPTGKAVTITVIELARIENGKMAEHWGGPDTFSLLQQLGVTFAPAK